ncbi:trypco2 family protein [Yinghuangia soli]|uniref:Trypsin-co-occurring domain-containing protein n=1 Tax=Yinghuangia soli TaxID=2908204 RepID=A0AA41Q454_9ACTN|nr:trypco2 family protein [Yinghuangia soli]MCF2530872.1 hypothetical protein [Yinghuangia soli]
MADSGMGLAAALEELRQELYQAQTDGQNQQFGFEIKDAELELLLELRELDEGSGKFSFGVATVASVSAGGSGQRSNARTHRLTLKLDIQDRAAGNTPVQVNDDTSGAWDPED